MAEKRMWLLFMQAHLMQQLVATETLVKHFFLEMSIQVI